MHLFDFLTKPLSAIIAATSVICLSAGSLLMPTTFPLQGFSVPASSLQQATTQTQTPAQAQNTSVTEHMPTTVPPIAPEPITPPAEPSDNAPVKPCVPCPTGAMPAENDANPCEEQACPAPTCPKCEPTTIGGKPHMLCPEYMCAALN